MQFCDVQLHHSASKCTEGTFGAEPNDLIWHNSNLSDTAYITLKRSQYNDTTILPPRPILWPAAVSYYKTGHLQNSK